VIAIDLSGTTALVTGGGRGLGRAIASALGESGANVVVNYLRDRKAAEGTVEDLRRRGVEALAVRADVSHAGDVERLLATAEGRFGGVQVFVSNAALTTFRDLDALTRRQVVRTFEIAAWPLLAIATHLFPSFEAAGFGRIVAVSSVGAARAVPGYAALGAAKGAVEALTRYLAEYAGRRLTNVTANAIVPSGFRDGDPQHAPHPPLAARMADEGARVRPPSMAEVASVAVFLASDLAAGVNGQAIVVDAGWSVA
jgi:enoyl-[acyl-carrier protein] reductase III